MSSYQIGMEARFAVAARHSRLVRFLRFAVPAVVALSLAMIVAVSVFNPFRYLARLPVDMGDIVVSGTKITMESPHLSGFSPDGRPYELWAKTATQDLTSPDHVELHTLRMKMLQEDQSTVVIEAREGLFDTKAQLLNLRQDVYLKTSTGNEAWLTKADVDMGNGSVFSDEPVDVHWLGGKVRGQRMRITEKGDVVRFDGGVVTNIDGGPGASQSSAEPAQKPEPLQQKPEPAQPKPRAAAGKANAK